MKAKEVLKRYATVERNFQNLDLRGQSFKGKDLSDADFSEADIRSANFTSANLRGAKFTGAKCGLQKRWATLLVILSWLLAGISGLSSLLTAGIVSLVLESDLNSQITGCVCLTVIIFFFIITIRQGIRTGVIVIATLLTIALLGLFFLSSLGITSGVIGAFSVVGVALVVGIVVATVAVVWAVTVAGKRAGVIAILLTGLLIIANPKELVVTLAVAFAVTLMVIYIAWRVMNGDKRDVWMRSFTIAFATIGGTSFRGADLTDTNFTGAKLKSTDLRKATLTRVRWYGAKMLDRVRPGDSYLQTTQVRQWLIGKGVDKNFDGQKLQGINLQGADLTDASFIDANLSGANLQDANSVSYTHLTLPTKA